MSHVTTDDGVKLYTEETGSGTPIVFVHEFAGDCRSWEPQVRHFSRRYRCITYNARGYPPSDVPEDVERYSQARARDERRGHRDAEEERSKQARGEHPVGVPEQQHDQDRTEHHGDPGKKQRCRGPDEDLGKAGDLLLQLGRGDARPRLGEREQGAGQLSHRSKHGMERGALDGRGVTGG